MKTLILNGSPRRHGDTATLVEAFTEYLHGEIVAIPAYSTGVAPCNDCRYCRSHAGCLISDDMQYIYTAVEKADIVVLASPMHYSTLSGPLLSLASRFQTYFSSGRFRGQHALPPKRRVGLLLLSGGAEGSVPEHAIAAAGDIFRTLRIPLVRSVWSLGTDVRAASEDAHTLAELRHLADGLNQCFSSGNSG